MSGLLFAQTDGSAHLHTTFHTGLVAVLTVCGLDPGLCEVHSFRIVVALYAARRGNMDKQIKLIGLRKSDAFHVYVRASFSLVS